MLDTAIIFGRSITWVNTQVYCDDLSYIVPSTLSSLCLSPRPHLKVHYVVY